MCRRDVRETREDSTQEQGKMKKFTKGDKTEDARDRQRRSGEQKRKSEPESQALPLM